MSQAYREQPVPDQLFEDADEQYTKMKTALASQELHVRSEADVARWMRDEQHELMRRLLQSHLRLRGLDQALTQVVDAAPGAHPRAPGPGAAGGNRVRDGRGAADGLRGPNLSTVPWSTPA
jgi:hypothetical protein